MAFLPGLASVPSGYIGPLNLHRSWQQPNSTLVSLRVSLWPPTSCVARLLGSHPALSQAVPHHVFPSCRVLALHEVLLHPTGTVSKNGVVTAAFPPRGPSAFLQVLLIFSLNRLPSPFMLLKKLY